MALLYYKYNTDYGNTIVDKSKTTFAPVSPYNEIHIDFSIPDIQPVYLYAVSGSTIIVNSQLNVDKYLGSIELPPTADGNVTYGEFTGSTTALSAATKALKTNKVNVSGDTMHGKLYFGNTATGTTFGSIGTTQGYNGLEIHGLAGLTLNAPYWVNPQWSAHTGSYLTIGGSGLITITAPATGATSWQSTGGTVSITANVPEDLGFNITPTMNVVSGTIEWNIEFTNNGNQDATVLLQGVVNNVVYGQGISYVVAKNQTSKLFGSLPLINTIVSGATVDVRITSDKNGSVVRSLLRITETGAGSPVNVDLQQVTSVGAQTNIETTLSGGLVTSKIRPATNSVTALQIRKADGTTVVANFDTVSGLTGFGTIAPKGLVHAYGTDAGGDKNGTQTNALITDGASNVDRDIQWAENGVPKWLAETYRGEKSKYWYLYNIDDNNSPFVASETGRVGINSPTNLVNYHAALVTGGPNDLVTGGEYTQSTTAIFELEIYTTGVTDTYRWRVSVNEGTTYGNWSTPSGCSTGITEIYYGVTVSFENVSGHVEGTSWSFAAFSQLPVGTFIISPVGFPEVAYTVDYTTPTITYMDVTANANSSSLGTPLTVFHTGTTKNAVYGGTNVKIDSVYLNMANSAVGVQLVVEYWTGSAWIPLDDTLHNYVDGTNNMSYSGAITWEANSLTGWQKAYLQNLSGETGYYLYWLRVRTTTSPTVAPITNSIARGGDIRFGVMSSPQDIKPSMYVDSLGRTNIGGGNIVGTNVLQISRNQITQSLTPMDSLVEIDSQDSNVSDLKIKLSVEDNKGAGLTIVKTRGTLSAPTGMATGDELGHIYYRGFVGASGRYLGKISGQYTGDGSTRTADLIFSTANGSDPVERVRITSSGTTGFGVTPNAVVHMKAGTTSVAPLKFTSGSLLTTPQTGAVEFNGTQWFGTTGSTRKTFAFLESPTFVGTPSFPSGTTFAQGLATCSIRPLSDGVCSIHIHKADNITPIVTFNTLSGFTGFGKTPDAIINTYGTDITPADGWNYQTNSVRLDGGFASDKDIQWFSEGQPKFAAQIYRCEDGSYWYLSSPQSQINQLTVSQTGRVGINNQTNIMNYHAILEAGGPNDITIGGNYTQNYTTVYQVQIDSITGVTNTFKWRKSTDEGYTYGSWTLSSGCTTGTTELEYGVTVQFDATTGHTLGTQFIFAAFAQLPIGTLVVTPNKINEVQTTLNYTATGTSMIYTDVSGEANSSRFGSNIKIFETGTTLNAMYFGTLDKLNSLFINLSNVGAGVTLISEYWNGSTWINITTANNAYHDGTENLSIDGSISWETSSMTGWISAYLPNLIQDGYQLYWIRLRTSTNPTIAPVAISFARGGNYRFGVLTSPFDFKPSMYVDSLGRTNIGGGNITGSNVFQINSNSNLPVTSGGHDSIAEFDSENGSVTDLKLKLSSNDVCDTGLILVNTRGTLSNPLDNQTGDYLGHIEFRGRFNGAGQLFGKIQSQFTGTGSDKDADIIISTADNGILNEVIRVSSSGTTGFGIKHPTAFIHITGGTTSNAPLRFTSGALLTSPQTGAVEFLGNKYYGTTTGGTRNTFAFLESPQFIGAPNLPVSTTLIGQSLCNLILYSGGNNNTCLVKTNVFNTYTGTTAQNTYVCQTTYNTYVGTTAPATYLKLNQTTPQCIVNGAPQFNEGIQFKTTGPNTSTGIGKLSWRCTCGIAGLEYGLSANVDLQIGQETVVYARNNTGVQINNGQIVYACGSSGSIPKIALADADFNLALTPLGMATEDIPNGSDGFVTLFGNVHDVNTAAYSAGTVLYLSTVAGAYTNVPADAPKYKARIGVVIKSDTNTGIILFNVLSIPKLSQLTDILETGLTTTGQFPVWKQSCNYFDFSYNINNYLTTSAFGTYTGTTAPATFASKSFVSTYTGTTAPATFASKSFLSTYTGTTAPATFASKSFVSTYTGTTVPATYLSKSSFSTYSGTTAPAAFASKSFVSNYTGTTAPATYASKSFLSTYTGTTAPAAFASKSFLNTYTGTTAPAAFASKSFLSTYTGVTTPIVNVAITGATNGLTKSGSHNVVLGGNLTQSTVITGNTFDFTLSSKALNLYAANGISLNDNSTVGIFIHSKGGNVDIKGNNSSGIEKTKFIISDTQAAFTDSRTTPVGIVYNADYSTNFTARSLVDKGYVDAHSGGGIVVKQAVSLATTGSIGLSGLTTVDGFTTTTGERILVKNQASTPANGVYSASTGVWGRVSDFDQTTEITNGSYFFVNSGTTNAKTAWVMNATTPIVVGVSAITFTLFSSSSGVAAGNGICVTQTGGNYNVAVKAPANCGLCIDSTGVYINSAIAGTGLCYATGVLCVNGSALAGNSISWTGNTFNVDIKTGTLSTALNSKLNTSTYQNYTGTTAPATFASKSFLSTYTGTTVPATYLSKTSFSTYSGTTAPATFASKSFLSTYTGTTAPAAFASKSFVSTYTGTTAPATFASKSFLNTYTGTTAPATYLSKTSFSNYSGTTAPAAFASKSFLNTYTGTTAPATFANKAFLSTYTGTTAPATFASKSFLNTYTGTTAPATFASKSFLSTYTGTTAPATFASKSFLSTYTGTTAPATFASKSFLSTYTGTTAPATYLSKTAFNTYSGTTAPAAFASKSFVSTYTGTTAPATFASKSFVSTYTGTTAPATYLSKTAFNTYSGTTVPNTYYNKTQINSYTGATATAIGLKAPITSPTFLVSANAPNPAQNDKSTCIVTTCWYSCQCATATPLMDGVAAVGTSLLWTKQDHRHPSDTGKTSISTFSTYTGTTAPAAFASKSFVSTYTGTTAPATYLSKTAFNTYSGTTVPANYYNKTQINSYTGATATAIGLKANTASPTFTGTVRSVTPIVNDNSTCIATTAWYIGQGGTATPLVNGTGACGTSNLFAREDHVHPTDTSRLAVTAFNTYSGNTATAIGLKANIASPTFTGTVTIPTPFTLGAVSVKTTGTELNYVTGATSNIQTQLNAKQATITGGATTITTSNLTINRALVSDGSGKVAVGNVTSTELNYLTGATSNIQTQIGLKAPITSPTFLVSAFAPKPALNNNGTCIATTSWYFSQSGSTSPLMDGSAAIGSSTCWSHSDHVHPSDTSRVAVTLFNTYTGTTAPATYASKTNAITGATNLGSGNAIYTSTSANKVQLKSISGGTGIAITNTGTQINVCSTITQFNWAGTTAFGVGTYVSASCVCSNPNMTFNGTALSVTGNINASTYVCSPIITGSTRVCSPIVCGTSCITSPKFIENGTCLASTYYPYNQPITGRTTTTTVDVTYANKIIEANGTFTITFPNSMAIGMTVDVINVGTGVITLAASTTINAKGGNLKIATQWAGASVYHRGSNVWVAVGDLTP